SDDVQVQVGVLLLQVVVVAVDGQLAVQDLLVQSVVLFRGEGLKAPGALGGGQAHSMLGNAQAGGNAADLGEGAVVDLGNSPLHSVGQALHGAGHNGVGLSG